MLDLETGMRVASNVGNLPFLLCVLELFAMYATDGQTDRQTDGRTDKRTKAMLTAPFHTVGGITNRNVTRLHVG